MPARRLVRREPWIDRIKSYLNPLDFLLWVSEELETSDWGQWQAAWSIPLGIILNVIMMIARANSVGNREGEQDVFGEDYSSTGWVNWLASFVTHSLLILSFVNGFYTFSRKKHYRLFETAIDEPPSTPSARRVKVDSSPAASPLSFLTSMLHDSLPAARAHPDSQKDVWEVSIWDPNLFCLQMFCLFSPGHALVYCLFLPTRPSDPRPSVTVATTIALAILLSLQLSLLQSGFSRKAQDTAIIQKEVMHEYDNKFVHPRLYPVVRDVGTQCSESKGRPVSSVEEYSPVTIVNRGFQTHPNPNYVGHVDPSGSSRSASPATGFSTSAFTSQNPANLRDLTSPLQQRPQLKPLAARASVGPGDFRSPNSRPSVGPGDGGNLGVYSHAHSPLKKSASTQFAPNSRLERVKGSPARRESGRF